MSGRGGEAEAVGTVEQALAHGARLLENRPEMALRQAEALMEIVPGDPRAQLLLGRALRSTGRAAQARDVLASLVEAQPRSAASALELGLAAADLGDPAAAAEALRRALTLAPDLAAGWTALADSLRLLGDVEGADRAHLESVRAATRDPAMQRAAAAMLEKRPGAAEALLRERLKARPADVAAIRMLGELFGRLGRLDEAVVQLRRAVELAPGFDTARELLARTLQRDNRPVEALAEVERLIARAPANLSYAVLKAALLVRIGDQDGARIIYERVLAANPSQPSIWMSLGHVLKTLGRKGEAVAAYREAVALRPTLGEAWWSLANLKTERFVPADLAAMRAALGQAVDEDDRLHLHFALGKALEDAGEDEAAFGHYAEGNRLRRAQLPYDAQGQRAECTRAAALFTPAFFAARAGQGCPAEDPIFIVGLPRAGSTLIEQILASHSQVEGTMELPDLMAMAARLRQSSAREAAYPESLAELDGRALRELGEEYLERTRIYRRTGRPRFIDKMPNNWRHVGLIRLILPNARIVDARRHPVGCCLSGWKQHFARGQAFSYDLGDIGAYYSDYVATLEAFERAAPGGVHRVHYEAMVADTEGEVRRLLAYLDLPFEPACLQFWKTERAVRTASSEQVRQPIFTDAVEHWRRFEPWLGPLFEALGPLADRYPATPGAA